MFDFPMTQISLSFTYFILWTKVLILLRMVRVNHSFETTRNSSVPDRERSHLKNLNAKFNKFYTSDVRSCFELIYWSINLILNTNLFLKNVIVKPLKTDPVWTAIWFKRRISWFNPMKIIQYMFHKWSIWQKEKPT